jgi:hypothetical protein
MTVMSVHALPSYRHTKPGAMSGSPPTAQSSSSPAPQMPNTIPEPGVSIRANASPSQCTIAPPVPPM